MKPFYCSPGKLCLYISYLILFYFLLCAWRPARGQTPYNIQGRVLSAENQEALVGASVVVRGTTNGTSTDKNGYFSLSTTSNKIDLALSFIGYRSLDTLLSLPLRKELLVMLNQDMGILEEVAVTGYQEIPKERATGSFVQIDNALLNRRVSTNLLDRLDGVSSGVFFTGQASSATSVNPLGRNLGIRIRGESTLADATQVSRDPLIVVDNFPYEGNLSNINPNDIESVTILRDAAAASIWGARAGNGVIVITTKKGSKNKPMQVEVNTNVTVANKPDLYYDKNYLPSSEYIQVEKILFDAGYFNADLSNATNRPPLSPFVELLAQKRAGTLSEQDLKTATSQLEETDVRRDYLRYVYQKAVSQQYSVGLKGGSNNAAYSSSVGYDHNSSNLKANTYNRFTINTNGTYSPHRKLELSVALNLGSNISNYPNSMNFGYLAVGGKYSTLYPYALLADQEGNALSIVKDYRSVYINQAESMGYLDWQYRPLDETGFADRNMKTHSLLARAGVKYKILKGLSLDVRFQNEQQQSKTWDHNSLSTYFVRDLINKFSIRDKTQGSFIYQIPKGGVLDISDVLWKANNLRTQFNYDLEAKNGHLSAIAGAEIRELKTEGNGQRLYGYDDALGLASYNLNYSQRLATNPSGTATIPNTGNGITGYLNRFVSVFGNAAYTYKGRYTLSMSARRDGANIFGANTNNKLTPLWSAGLLWNLGSEKFYKIPWLPYLRLRASYGYNGNAYQGSVYTTGTYSVSDFTGATTIVNLTAPNPELRWEKVGNLNIGIDFATKNDLLSGSIEIYQKTGQDLIQDQALAPSKGFQFFYGNSAGTLTRGMDLTLKSSNINREVKWTTIFLVSLIKDKITRFDQVQTASSIRAGAGRPGLVGKPLYSIYSYKWAGLDPTNGDPQGYLNGEVSKEYLAIMNNFNPDSLVFHGSARPTVFGSIRNEISWKRLSLSVNLIYKLGYYFRRPSTTLNYQNVLTGGTHADYVSRWKSVGDEQQTSVPSLVYPSNNNRSTFYQYAQILVEKGDHIRLQDVRLEYEFPHKKSASNRLQALALYVYANNLGIIWRTNRQGLDPDFVGTASSHTLPSPCSLSLGAKVTFK